MDEIFSNRCVSESNDSENSPENSCDSLLSGGMFNGSKMMTLTSSSSKSRRAKQKRVISVPMKDVEESKLNKVEIRQPPCDTWAWRKYGQKPIKGSPYPRGYYRCSSSKGCPARKQVERSRADPNMLLLTYSYEHNHNWPASKSNSISTTITVAKEKEPSHFTSQSDQLFGANFGESLSINEFGWFESTSSSLLETPILTESNVTDADMLAIFSIREEDDDSLFADLGELPEFSNVFSAKMMERNGELA